jgi:alpha-L-rhamnosidase
MLNQRIWKTSIMLLCSLFAPNYVSGADNGKADQTERLCPASPKRDFSANWIWLPDVAGYESRNSYAYFRKTFSAGGDVSINIAADTWYQFYIDGRFIDRGTAASDVRFKSFDTFQVKLDPGQHCIAVLVHHIGQTCATAMRSRPGLFVEMTDGSGKKIVSDASWKATPALAFQQYLPCMMSHFGFYEICDCEKIPANWTEKSFDDSSWYSAQVIGRAGCEPWLLMIPRDMPLLATTIMPVSQIVCRGTYQAGAIAESEKEITVAVEMAARSRTKTPASALTWPVSLAANQESEFVVLDFGREVTGHVRLFLQGAKSGQKVDIGYDETLDKNGLPNPRRTYVHFSDRYFLAKDQIRIDVLGARGFRYLLIDVMAGKGGLTVTKAEIEERTYPISTTNVFHCSDDELNRLFQVGLTTTKLCMLDAYVDCPSRERVMWMDMYPEAHCSSYGFGITQLWRHCLFLFAQNTSTANGTVGAVKGFAPCDYDPLLISYIMYYVISTADYVLHSGDLAAGQALFPTLMQQFDVISRYTTSEGLINEKFPGWGTFLDWSAMDFGGVSAGNNAIYILMHRKTAELARQVQKQEVARDLDSKADRLSKIFVTRFWSPQEQMFIDAVNDGQPSACRSQWVNVMAVLAGVVKDDAARFLLKKVTDKKSLLPRTSGDFRLRPGFKPQTGGIVPIGTPGSGFLMAQALFETGMNQEAMEYYKENWSPITKNSTFMEHFVEDPNTSYCHGWGAGPVVSLVQYVLGVSPVAPGWQQIVIQPHPGHLSWAEGTIHTPAGEIQVAWKKVNGKLQVTHKAPDGVSIVKGF